MLIYILFMAFTQKVISIYYFIEIYQYKLEIKTFIQNPLSVQSLSLLEMKSKIQVQNLDKTVRILLYPNSLGKGMNPSLLLSAMGKL